MNFLKLVSGVSVNVVGRASEKFVASTVDWQVVDLRSEFYGLSASVHIALFGGLIIAALQHLGHCTITIE